MLLPTPKQTNYLTLREFYISLLYRRSQEYADGASSAPRSPPRPPGPGRAAVPRWPRSRVCIPTAIVNRCPQPIVFHTCVESSIFYLPAVIGSSSPPRGRRPAAPIRRLHGSVRCQTASVRIGAGGLGRAPRVCTIFVHGV